MRNCDWQNANDYSYHPKNTPVSKILSRNYNILTNDDSTRFIFPKLPLKAYRRAKTLRDLFVHSDFPVLPNQHNSQAPSPASEPSAAPVFTLTSQPQFHHQEDNLRSQGISRALQIKLFTAFLAVNVPEMPTSGRQDAGWLTVSGNTDSTSYTRKVTCRWRNTSTA